MGNETKKKSNVNITLSGSTMLVLGAIIGFVGIAGFNDSPGRYGEPGGGGFQFVAFAGIALGIVGIVFLMIALFRAVDSD